MILANCTDCGSVHGIGSRPTRGGTTACPDCEAPSYRTGTLDQIEKIVGYQSVRNAVAGANGVGSTTADNIDQTFSGLEDLCTASESTLTDINGVGSSTATNIQSRLPN